MEARRRVQLSPYLVPCPLWEPMLVVQSVVTVSSVPVVWLKAGLLRTLCSSVLLNDDSLVRVFGGALMVIYWRDLKCISGRMHMIVTRVERTCSQAPRAFSAWIATSRDVLTAL